MALHGSGFKKGKGIPEYADYVQKIVMPVSEFQEVELPCVAETKILDDLVLVEFDRLIPCVLPAVECPERTVHRLLAGKTTYGKYIYVEEKARGNVLKQLSDLAPLEGPVMTMDEIVNTQKPGYWKVPDDCKDVNIVLRSRGGNEAILYSTTDIMPLKMLHPEGLYIPYNKTINGQSIRVEIEFEDGSSLIWMS